MRWNKNSFCLRRIHPKRSYFRLSNAASQHDEGAKQRQQSNATQHYGTRDMDDEVVVVLELFFSYSSPISDLSPAVDATDFIAAACLRRFRRACKSPQRRPCYAITRHDIAVAVLVDRCGTGVVSNCFENPTIPFAANRRTKSELVCNIYQHN